ncbi:hypothetical protein AVEN_117206-1 [Araneus ventricosus]|uniref:Uncharacterized protein n=1 Tax=Araneus ventricosus TaxID=182803 RepID=A0A4Y2AY21_ARAVE|nr:hypothetical protein AVEN_117206-1 [Araneus ventricosus]
MPRRETDPPIMTFPPPYFIVGIWYLGSKRVPWRRRIHCIPSVPNNMYLLSSLQRISCHSFFQSSCAFVHSTRALRFFVEIIGFLPERLPFSEAARTLLLIVRTESFGFWGSQRSREMSTAVKRGLTRERRKTFLSKRRDVERGRPDLEPSALLPDQPISSSTSIFHSPIY